MAHMGRKKWLNEKEAAGLSRSQPDNLTTHFLATDNKSMTNFLFYAQLAEGSVLKLPLCGYLHTDVEELKRPIYFNKTTKKRRGQRPTYKLQQKVSKASLKKGARKVYFPYYRGTLRL